MSGWTMPETEEWEGLVDAIGLMRTGWCVLVDAIWQLLVWSFTGQMVANWQLQAA